jgi:hypothetical protein
MNQYFIGCFVFLQIGFSQLYAQSGIYNRIVKDETEQMELRNNGTFTYTYHTGFAKSFTEGTWRLEGKTVVFRSAKQVVLKVEETKNEKNKNLKIAIQAPSARKGPRNVEKVLFNNQIPCSKDETFALEYLKRYNEIMTIGSNAQKDSLKTSFAPRLYNSSEFENQVDSICIYFDKKKAVYKPLEPTSNEFIVKVILDEDSMYKYFEDEVWQWIDKKILAPPIGDGFKKGKK